MQVTLVMYKADGARRDFPLGKPRVLIGRHNTCELRVPLPSVSRKHCELKVSSGSVKLRDLGSSNGTYVNGSRVKAETPLSPGDRIQVGAVIFTLVVDGVPAMLEPTDTLMAAQAMAERAKGAGPAEAKVRKSREAKAQPSADEKTTIKKPAAKPEPASAASDELDALLSQIGDDLLDRSHAGAAEDSGAAVELIPDDDDDVTPEPSSAQIDEQIAGEAQSSEPSEVDDMLSSIEDQIAEDDDAEGELLSQDVIEEDAAEEDMPELDDSDEIVETLPELDDSDEIDITDAQAPKPAPPAPEPPPKKKKKKSAPADAEDPISALEAMADGADDSDIDLSWLDDDAH